MKKYLKVLLLPTIFGLFISGCQHSELQATGQTIDFKNNDLGAQGRLAKQTRPKNIILMIGDGMGLSQISATMQAHREPLNIESAPVIGLSRTLNSQGGITDSAAAATAFSIGVKTFNGAIGVDANGLSQPTILEQFAERGLATGLIATSEITHATPASFYAHVPDRQNANAIAEALAKSEVDLFIGGGEDYFDKRDDETKGIPDDRNLLIEMQKKGVELVDDLKQLEQASGRVGMFIADRHPKSIQGGRGDILADSILPVAQFLQRQSDMGFFLVVEGAQIDWGGHANDFDYVSSELLDFDRALGQALGFAANNNDTLIVVTADHETGGLTMVSKDYNDQEAKPEPVFSTAGHTAIMVPVFSFGIGAEQFSGVYQNTEIYHKLLNAIAP